MGLHRLCRTWTVVLAGLAVVGLLPPVACATTVLAAAGAASSVRAGFFCRVEPDAKVAASDSATGQLNVYDDPFHFVHLGDAVPSVPGIGIGVVIRMDKFRPGEALVIRSKSDFSGRVESWAAAPNDKGLVWLGYLGDASLPYPPGHWRFEVLRGKKVIFAYEFSIMPASSLPELVDLCLPVSS